jgi:hypothetical protein
MNSIYSVEIDKEIYQMLNKKNGLSPFFRKSGRRFIKYLFEYKFHRHLFFLKEGPPKASISLLRELINSSNYFDNELFHIVFKAFVFAETRFIQNYIPQNSHEERLTGHLISEYSSALNIIKKTFEDKALEIYNEKKTIEFYYADLSSNKMEKTTGSDFGIIFHLNLPDYPNEVRAVVFQAKKFKSNAKIDIPQCKALKKFGNQGAYYCFYDMDLNETSSPLVIQANRIYLSSEDETNISKTYSREDIFEKWDGGIPLSIFLIFNLLCGENEDYYKSFKNIWEANNYINNRQNKELEGFNPSKILIVSLGGITNSGQDLRDLSRLYDFRQFED